MSLFLLALCSGNAQADTPPQQRSLLLGGTMEVHAPQVRIDPLLPRGRLIEPNRHERPPLTRCSLRAPVCVHADRPEQLEPALSALQQAFELLVIGLGWPSPWGLSPGVSSLHWSVTDQPLELSVTRRPSRAFDRGHASCHGGPAGPGSAERCVAEAVIAELAPATASWLRAGLAEAARELLQRGDTSGPPSWALAQRQPEEGVLLPASDLRSSLFMNYLMKRSPEQTPLSAPLAALLIAATKTRPGALRYNAEPDLLDALRTNLDGDRTRFARLLDAFAVYRWTEAESEPALLPELAWDIPVSSLPRTLVLPRALAPGGSAYVQIELDQAQAGYVAMRTSCEEPVSYVWSLLVLDENHHVQRHVPVTFREQSFHEEARIGELAHAHALVAVGTNLGGVDLAHPFDPDHGPHERHGCRVTFDALPEPSATARPTQ